MLRGDLYSNICLTREAEGRTWQSIADALGMRPNNVQAAVAALKGHCIKQSVISICEELGYDIFIGLERKE